MIALVLLVLAVAGVLLAALHHQPRQETTMPGFNCQRCDQPLVHSQTQAGSPPRGFWVTFEDGRFGFDCPAGPGGHEPPAQVRPPAPGAVGYVRRFYLERNVDVSGVSGTGVVAEGVVFSDDTTVLRWIAGDHYSTVVWPHIDDVEAIHGHGGATRIVWVDVACRACGCTDDEACYPTCHWVEPDLCSACVGRGDR